VNNDWIDIEVLEDYLEGKLDAKTMNRVEREALEDPFVAEALAGLSNSPKRSLESISLLQKQLQERVAEHQHSKKTAVITWQRLSIAATAAVLFIAVGIIFWMRQSNYQDMLARQPKKVDVNLAPRVFKDSAVKQEIAIATTKTAPIDTFKAKAIESAITVAKTESYALNKKSRANAVITPAEPVDAPVAATESAAVLNEVAVAAAPQARQKALAFSSGETSHTDGTKTVTGRVIDEKSGEPLPNAGIYVGTPMKGIGSTDRNGNYSVAVPADATDLTFTFTGYDNQRVKIIGNSFDIALKETKNELNDVVIRGYQKRSREQTTGSSFVVSGKEVQDVPVANVEQLLQGKVAGLNIQNNTGAPGKRGSTNIRGLGTLSETNSAQPSNGWEKFRAYLSKTNRFGNETKPGQSAEFKFSIKNGRPKDIITVKGVSKDYDEEAIRLIKNGPSWKLSDPTHPEVNVILKF
jgi:hypothetical protein